MSGPLDGLVVVAIEQAVSAPFATRHLGDLGARVIKVERVGAGDFAREYDDEVAGMASHFVWINRNKESLALDFKTAEGRAILDELIAGAKTAEGRAILDELIAGAGADVVVQNLAPGAAARLGLSAAQLVGRHPALIACDVSGYGEGGPYSDRRAYDLVVQAESASISTTGWAQSPAKPGIPIADLSAGIYAFSSILAALYQRERTGDGRAIQVSLFDAISEWMGYSIYFTQGSGRRHVPNGVSHPSLSPYGAFVTVDGRQVVVAVQNDREWSRMADRVLGNPDLAVDPRFATSTARTAHRAEVSDVCARVLGDLTLDQAMEVLDAAGVACGRVNHSDELLVHPQLEARDRWRAVDSPVGPIRSLLPPPLATGWSPRMDPIPDVGSNTLQILRGLGRSETEITVLVAAGVVGLPAGESDRTGERDGRR